MDTFDELWRERYATASNAVAGFALVQGTAFLLSLVNGYGHAVHDRPVAALICMFVAWGLYSAAICFLADRELTTIPEEAQGGYRLHLRRMVCGKLSAVALVSVPQIAFVLGTLGGVPRPGCPGTGT